MKNFDGSLVCYGCPAGFVSLSPSKFRSMAAVLLSKGDTVIIEKVAGPDANYEKQVDSIYYAIVQEDGIGKGRYYVLLLDTGSASCAEIFAVALTSNLKNPVVGKLSYGKGIGQYYISTPDSGIASATALRLFDKDGVSYHSYGIVPDFEIADTDLALSKAVELAEAETYSRTAGYGTSPLAHWTEPKTKKVAETPLVRSFERDGAFKIIQQLNWLRKKK